MPLTKIKRGGLDTGITDNSDANALTFDSSENAIFKGEVKIDAETIMVQLFSDLNQITFINIAENVIGNEN